MRCLLALAIVGLSTLGQVRGGDDPVQENAIYQYFVPSTAEKASANSGAYLWIPPNTPQIRAVMIGIHNGLPIGILQNPAVREICRKHGIAQVLLTPNGSEIGPVMLKNLNFDVTDASKTAVYDAYLKALAEASGHPELITAPIVPLAHSAYMDFPFDAAMRKPEQCLASIPIKAGIPDKYAFYAPGGKSTVPAPDLALKGVPLLVVTSSSQETVGWGPYPRGASGVKTYRRDHQDNTGETYEPGNEMMGICWDLSSGHFDMLPRNYRFVADWLDAIATARLPEKPGDPLKTITLKDGWLIDPRSPAAGGPTEVPPPARYADFTGDRTNAVWYPTEELARRAFDLMQKEPAREIEMFTFRDPDGNPISLAHGQMATMPTPEKLFGSDGTFRVETWHFTEPFGVCTNKEKGHEKDPNAQHPLENIIFPGKTSLPLSGLQLNFDPNAAPITLVKAEPFKDSRGVDETRFTLRLQLHRLSPDAGFQMFFPRVYHEGDSRFAAAGRTTQIQWWLGGIFKEGQSQTIDFPDIPDAPASSGRIELKATSSAGLPVGYFVRNGPGIIRDGAFIPMEVPAGLGAPIPVTIGAYQLGSLTTGENAVKPAATVYRTFHLTP